MSQLRTATGELGNESYEDRFTTFLNYTTQKSITAALYARLMRQLHKFTGTLYNQHRLCIADLGCGEGTQAEQLIANVRTAYDGDICFVGLDSNPTFLESFQQRLDNLNDPHLKIESRRVDLFDSQSLGINDLDIIIASHVMYYSDYPKRPHGVTANAASFVNKLVAALGTNGVAIMIHESRSSDQRVIGTAAGSTLMADVPGTTFEICAEHLINIVSIPFEAPLFFPTLTQSEWNSLNSLVALNAEQLTPSMHDTVKLLGFIVQRNLREMDDSDLEMLIDEVRRRIRPSRAHALTLRSELQILMSRECHAAFPARVRACAAAVINDLGRA